MTVDNKYLAIYNEIKKLPKETVKETIDSNYKIYGLHFLESLIVNAILDIESAPNNLKPNLIIAYIEKYSARLIAKEEWRKNIPEILNTWQIWLVAIGTFGLFLLELLKFLIDHLFCCCR